MQAAAGECAQPAGQRWRRAARPQAGNRQRGTALLTGHARLHDVEGFMMHILRAVCLHWGTLPQICHVGMLMCSRQTCHAAQ